MRSKRMKRSKKGKRSRIPQYKTRVRNRKPSSKRTKIKKRTRRKKVKKSKRLKGGSGRQAGGPVGGPAVDPSAEVQNPSGGLEAVLAVAPELIAHELDIKALARLLQVNRPVSREVQIKTTLAEKREAVKFITDNNGVYLPAKLGQEQVPASAVLEGNEDIEEVSLIARLTELEHLNLSDNRIKDVTPLGSLEALTTLGLGGNQIQDVAPLGPLKVLTTLGLGGNHIEDVTPLGSLKALTMLGLGGNRIADVEGHTPALNGLITLTSLQKLNLGDNQIKDLTPLGSCLLYTSPSPRDRTRSRMPSSA